MKKFAVVLFEDGLQLVPSKWMKKNLKNCSYPNFDSRRMNRAIKNQDDAEDDWDIYKVIRIMGYADSYEDGLKKLSRAEHRSDIENSTDINDDYIPRRKKQKSVASFTLPNLTVSSSDESDGNDFLSKEPLPRPNSRIVGREGSSSSFIAPICASTPSSETKERNSKKVSRMLTKLEFKVDKLQGTLDQVLDKLNENNNAVNNNLSYSSNAELLPKFPLESIEAVDELEEKLKDEAFRCIMIGELRKLGGKTVVNLINNQLSFLLAYHVGMKYSYFGTKEKKALSALRICCVVSDVVRLSLPNATNEELKEPISSWLRHCKEKSQKKNL